MSGPVVRQATKHIANLILSASRPAKRLVPGPLKTVLRSLVASGQATADYTIVSYPKAGRTWVRVMIGKALCDLLGQPDTRALQIHGLLQEARLPAIGMTHDGSSSRDLKPWQELDSDKSHYRGKTVVFLTRNLKDLIVSNYFALSRRAGIFDGSIADFIRSDIHGVRRILEFYRIWDDSRHVPAEFLHVRYEDFRAEPERWLRATFDKVGLSFVSDESVRAAVAFADFANMQRMEQEDYFGTQVLRPRNLADHDSFKTRRGVVGGYRDYLSDEDVAYIDRIEQQVGNPFA